MRKVICALLVVVSMAAALLPAAAADVPRVETPEYTVAFYAYPGYHIQDEYGQRSGYGYEMMQGLARHMQCTFRYVGYDKTPDACEQLLQSGQIDLYTAARLTPERQAQYAVSRHPAITASTCMNVKADNTSVIPGDYATYDGLRVGLLSRHTYNGDFLDFASEKGFSCDVVYFETPSELSAALICGEVDAIVDSYISAPVDEITIEDFGQTPYYIIARKEDQALIDAIDDAIDAMNLETPNWRASLFTEFYGAQAHNTTLTADEQTLLAQLQAEGTVVRGVMQPDNAPFSWFADGEAHGITADIFRATAAALGLSCEILPAASQEQAREAVASGEADVWIDLISGDAAEGASGYRLTDAYLTASVSVLRRRGATGRIARLAIHSDCVAIRQIIDENWPDAEVILLDSADACAAQVVNGSVDGALFMSYTAQRLAREDVQNRLRVEIVSGASLALEMGVNAEDLRDFYGLWEKTLARVAEQQRAEIVQRYTESTDTVSFIAYLYNNPTYLIALIAAGLFVVFLLLLFVLAQRASRRQAATADQLARALDDARRANDAKANFFSKMSHDIRTPLNVVLGMTQIAQRCKGDEARLDDALRAIASEGNYLLVLINSILDVNQLEHGHIELACEPFSPAVCVRESVDVLRPLAEKKQQSLHLALEQDTRIGKGDANRFSQIIINIVSNAIKYTDPGGTIDVSLHALPDGRWRFVCADNGIGMQPDFIEHITEDFARAEDSRVSKTQGAGLGMAVVKGFTDRMGGTLDVRSAPGEGSVFTVELPFPDASEEECASLRAPEETEHSRIALFPGRCVLLAEDNALNAEIARALLGELGLCVDWAEDGAAAIARFCASAPGHYFAVFIDMQMPGTDGVAAARAIRASGRPDCAVPIFAMTANTFASDRQLCLDAGMNGMICKPIRLAEIESALLSCPAPPDAPA